MLPSILKRFLHRAYTLLLKPVYMVYEKKLMHTIKKYSLPKHIAIIPDGNRRWANTVGLPSTMGHEYGYRKMKEVLKWLDELGIRIVTIYAMSYENCIKRSDDERNHLFELIYKGLTELIEESEKRNIKINVIGRFELIPDYLKSIAYMANEKTKGNDDRIINIALCYGGRQEIVDAIKKLVEDMSLGIINKDEISEDVVSRYMYMGKDVPYPDPDLVIRTSGEIRISNFLLWNSAYSELYFCEAFWPEFRKIDLLRAIRSYQARERRFGS